MHHVLLIVEMWTDEPLDRHKGIISASHICEEFAETDKSRGFVDGLTIHIARLNGAGYQALDSHSGSVAPRGAGHHDHFAKYICHGLCALIVGDDLPQTTKSWRQLTLR